MIVVPTYRAPEALATCLASIAEHAIWEDVRVVDNAAQERSGYETGALLSAYADCPEQDDYLLMHDSMRMTRPILDEWRIMRHDDPRTVVALAGFPLNWDNAGQLDWLVSTMPEAAIHATPTGIFGCSMLAPRVTLDLLGARGMLPPIPRTKGQAQATERQWAMSFAACGVPVRFVLPHYRPLMEGRVDCGIVKTMGGRG